MRLQLLLGELSQGRKELVERSVRGGTFFCMIGEVGVDGSGMMVMMVMMGMGMEEEDERVFER